MDSKHRKELHTNELGRLTQELAPVLEPYGTKILIGVCAAAIVVGGIYVVRRNSRESAETAWNQFFAAQGSDALGTVADNFGGTNVAAFARLRESEAYLQEAVRLSFVDRPASAGEFKKAKESLDKLLSQSSLPGELRERALIDRAKLAEATAAGKADEIVAAYKEVLTEFPDTVYKTSIERRIAELKHDEFYAWFSKENPKPEDRKKPADGGLPPGHPPIGSLPLPGSTGPALPSPELPTLPAPELPTGPAPATTTPDKSPEPEKPATPDKAGSPADPPKTEGTEPKSGPAIPGTPPAPAQPESSAKPEAPAKPESPAPAEKP